MLSPTPRGGHCLHRGVPGGRPGEQFPFLTLPSSYQQGLHQQECPTAMQTGTSQDRLGGQLTSVIKFCIGADPSEAQASPLLGSKERMRGSLPGDFRSLG